MAPPQSGFSGMMSAVAAPPMKSSAVGGGSPAEVFVGRWPLSLQEDALREMFRSFGPVLHVRVQPPSKRTQKMTYAFVVFPSEQHAREAIVGLNGKQVDGALLQVQLSEQSTKSAAQAEKEELRQRSQTMLFEEERRSGRIIEASPKGHGWLKADLRIEHELAFKHGGKVYIHRNDFSEDAARAAGARVSFLVYVDDDGLGAKDVRLIGLDERIPARTGQRFARYNNHAEGGATDKSNKENGGSPTKWWESLDGECCPISLTPLPELLQEPYGIFGSAAAATAAAIAVVGSETHEQLPAAGIWGKKAAAIMTKSGSSQPVVHWFDGAFLACTLVSKGNFVDPVNMRQISRGECQDLDQYLRTRSAPELCVTEAFDLAKKQSASKASSQELSRLSSLQERALSVLRIMDDGHSTELLNAKDAMCQPSGSGTSNEQSGVGERRRRWRRDRGD